MKIDLDKGIYAILNDEYSFVELIDSMGSDLTVVNSARVSLNKSKRIFEKEDIKLINYLLKHKHTSPFEHVTFTFRVSCPLFVARQWMRHRTQSYSEVSRRYTSEEIAFYIPLKYRKQAELNRQGSLDEDIGKEGNASILQMVESQVKTSLNVYQTMLNYGVAREQARMVLPQNMYTQFFTTVNLHNLLKFLELRNHPDAQYEIQLYAQALEKLITPIVPVTIDAWKTLRQT